MYGVMSMSTTQIMSPAPVQVVPQMNAAQANIHSNRDIHWDMLSVVDRLTYYSTVSFSTTNTARQSLLNVTLPVTGSTLQQVPFKNFLYWRGSVRVRLDVAGTKACSGKLLVAMFPVTTQPVDASCAFVLPHAIIDVAGSTTTEILLPYINDQDYVIGESFACGTLRIWCLESLVVATGNPTSIPITISIAFPNSSFCVPVLQQGVSSTLKGVVLDGNSVTRIMNVSSKRLVMPINTTGDVIDLKNQVDPSLSTAVGVGGSAPSASILPAVSDGSHPEPVQVHARGYNARQVDGTDTQGITGGMDLVGNTMDPMLLWRYDRPNFASVANIEPVFEFRQYPGSESLVAAQDFGTTIDEMRVDYLTRIPGYIGRITIPTTNASGDLLASLPVCPSAFHIQQSATGVGTGSFQGLNLPTTYTPSAMVTVPWISYLQGLADYWTGDLEFTFVFASNTFATGSIQFVMSYDINNTTAMTLALASNQYVINYDIADQRQRITIRVPYMSLFKLSSTCPGQYPNQVSGSNSGGFPSTHIIGFLSVMVVNQVTNFSGYPGAISADIYLAGGPNFQLAGVSGNGSGFLSPSIGTFFSLLLERSQAKAPKKCIVLDALGDEELTSTTTVCSASQWTQEAISIVPEDRVFPIASISGERFTSLRDLLKRRWYCNAASPYFPAGSIASIPVPWLFASCPYYPVLDCFQLIRGSFRVTFEVAPYNDTYEPGTGSGQSEISGGLTVMWFPSYFMLTRFITNNPINANSELILGNLDYTGISANDDPLISPGFLHATVTRQTPCVTLEIPFSWRDRTYNTSGLTKVMTSLSDGDTPWGHFMFISSFLNPVIISMHAGFADDFHFGRLITPPIIAHDENSYTKALPTFGGTI